MPSKVHLPQTLSWHRRGWLVLAAGLGVGAGQSAAAPPPLRVGWDDYPPYQQVASEPQGPRLFGLDILLAEAIAERANLRLKWVRMPWARQLMSLQDGSLDLCLAASRLPEREAFAHWTQAYRPERAALMALKDPPHPVPALLELRGWRIGLIRGTSYPGEVAMALRERSFTAQLQPLRHAEQGLRMLREGRLDFVIDDPVTMNHLARRDDHAPLKVVRWLMRGEARLMLSRRTEMVRPGLLAALDAAITSLRADGSLRAPLKSYPDLLDP